MFYTVLDKKAGSSSEFSEDVIKLLETSNLIQDNEMIEANFRDYSYKSFKKKYKELDKESLNIKTEKYIIAVTAFGGYDYFGFSFQYDDEDFKNVEPFLSYFIREKNMIFGYKYNCEYHLWQNMNSISYYELEGRDHSKLPKKSNGFPYPLEETVIDISNNPGRRVYHRDYIEAIGNIMWLSDRFFELTNSSKEEVLSADWIEKKQLPNNILEIKVYDKCFDDSAPKDVQFKLRKILFPNSN